MTVSNRAKLILVLYIAVVVTISLYVQLKGIPAP